MPLFLSVRAAVRAHVHGAASATQEVPAQVAQSRQRARQYLALALSLLEPAPARLVAVGGLSGSGKSTLAARLAPHVGTPPGARVLRSDVIRKQLAGQPPAQPLPPESYTPQASARVYRHMGARAARLLAQGTSVIADAVFARPEERQAIASMADVAFGGIWLETSADLLRQRVTNRRGDASDATAEVVDRQLGYAIGDVTPWHRVTSDGTADEVARRAAKAIRLDIPV